MPNQPNIPRIGRCRSEDAACGADGLVATGRRQRQFDRIRQILGPHVSAKIPCNDVAAVVI